MSDPMVLTGAVGEAGWSPGGTAASLLDGINAAGDGKSADWNQSGGLDVADSLRVAISAHPDLPASVDVTLRHVVSLGARTLEEIADALQSLGYAR